MRALLICATTFLSFAPLLVILPRCCLAQASKPDAGSENKLVDWLKGFTLTNGWTELLL
jgi:hypothetical protein